MSRPSNTMAPAAGAPTPAMALSSVDLPAPLVPSSATTSPSSTLEVDAEQHLHAVVGDVDVADEEELDLALLPAVADLGLGRGRRPHLGDVGLHVHRGRREDGRADEEHRHHHEEAAADPVPVGQPADDVQHDEAGQHEQGRHRVAEGADLGRDGERERGEDPGGQQRGQPGHEDVGDHGHAERGREGQHHPGTRRCPPPRRTASAARARGPGSSAGRPAGCPA